jgi:hypothetical protein
VAYYDRTFRSSAGWCSGLSLVVWDDQTPVQIRVLPKFFLKFSRVKKSPPEFFCTFSLFSWKSPFKEFSAFLSV